MEEGGSMKEIETLLGKTTLEYLQQRSDMSDREKNVILDMMVLNNSPLFICEEEEK